MTAAAESGPTRRLLLTVCAVALMDTMLYAVLTPLLPQMVRELHVGEGTAGLLVAAFAVGSFTGALPAGLVSAHLGSKAAVILGMTLLSIASLVFAMAGSLEGLLAARFVQGLSSAMSWSGALGWLLSAAPRQHRGHLLGVALGAGIFGAVFGPVLGSVAALTSREVVFIGVAALAGVTALWSLSIHYKRPRESSSGALSRALRTTTFLAGLAMMVLPAVLIGVVLVLGPLHLAHYGWGAAAIGGVWLVTAVIQSSISPVLGQMSDRRGPQAPILALLTLAICLAVALATIRLPLPYAVLLVALSTTYGGLYSPAFALIAKGAEEARFNQGVAFAVMNMAWALGAVVGPAAGGAIAQTEGDRIPLLISAGICAVAAVGLLARSRRQIPDTPVA